MKTYNLYVKNNSKNLFDITDVVAISEGFNWWCLLFGIFWALYRQVWNLVIAYLVIFILFGSLTEFGILSPATTNVIKFFIATAFAFNANDLRGKALIAQGYAYRGIVVEKDREGAIMKFCDKTFNVNAQNLA